jgi:serine/threonine-protein kinase
MCFTALTGEAPPARGIPPVKLVRPETPESLATALDRGLSIDPADRFPSLGVLLRAVERGDPSRKVIMVRGEPGRSVDESAEARVRWAVGDDYEILSKLGSGAFGTVWRARDLSLEREVALKALHPAIARDDRAVRAFWREAKLAAQLAHPAIVPIYDWDSSGELSWYTMELAEEGSVASLVARSGPRQLSEIATQVEQVLDGLSVAHADGYVSLGVGSRASTSGDLGSHFQSEGLSAGRLALGYRSGSLAIEAVAFGNGLGDMAGSADMATASLVPSVPPALVT